eukprot:779247-Pyramimonas_sp.AAC.1
MEAWVRQTWVLTFTCGFLVRTALSNGQGMPARARAVPCDSRFCIVGTNKLTHGLWEPNGSLRARNFGFDFNMRLP